MKKFNTTRIVSLLLALVMLMSMVSLNVFAEESAPTVDVKAKNLWYGETYYPMFAIDAQNVPAGGTVDVAITKNGEAIGAVRLADDAAVIDEVSYPAFRAAEGVPAADIDTLYTVQALIKDASGNVVASSDTYTYSILQYVYEMLYIVPADQKADEKDLCTKFLAFAQASEKLNAETTELTDTVYVNCVNTVAESGTGTGIYAKGDVKFTTDLVVDSGTLIWNVTNYDTGASEQFEDDGTNSLVLTLDGSVKVEPIVAASAEPVDITLSFASTANRTEFSTTEQVWVSGDITLTNNKSSSTTPVADYSNPVRFYAKSELIVDCATMQKIVFTCSSSSYASALNTSIGTPTGATVTVSGSNVTVEFSSPVDTFTITLSGQVRMNSMTVTALRYQ